MTQRSTHTQKSTKTCIIGIFIMVMLLSFSIIINKQYLCQLFFFGKHAKVLEFREFSIIICVWGYNEDYYLCHTVSFLQHSKLTILYQTASQPTNTTLAATAMSELLKKSILLLPLLPKVAELQLLCLY